MTYVVGWLTYVVDWRGVVSQNRIINYAWNLLTSLVSYCENDGTVVTRLQGCREGTDTYRIIDRYYLSAIAWEGSYTRTYVTSLMMMQDDANTRSMP